jgi:hypothetical protein
MINSLDDKYPRLQAHAAASLTNFLEGATDDIVESHIQIMNEKLIKMVHDGNTMCKENAVTCIATVAEAAEDKFQEFYEYTMKELSPYLVEKADLKYYQFKGQLIESIVLISVSVGKETFLPHAQELINLLLQIQDSIFNETGVCEESKETIEKSSEHHILQSYLLTAWEKLAYLMTDDFVPYLERIVPTLLKIASLNIEYKTSEQQNLIENEDEQNNIVSSEVDEKTSALQMMQAFVDELKSGFAQYVEPASQIILPMLTYSHSETIRSTAAQCIKGLMVCIIEGTQDRHLQVRVAEKYLEELWNANKNENETEILGYQCQAIRDVIKEMKTPFMSEEVVNTMCKRCVQMIQNSDKRKAINEDYTNENIKGQGENVDHQDVELMDQENENEDEFQIAISEIFGALFKTHKAQCGALCKTLFDDILPNYLQDDSPDIKKRFSLYIIVDMIEYLKYDYLEDKFEHLMKFLMEYSSSEVTVLRQSAIYGLGMAATHCRGHFFPYIKESIQLLKNACDWEQGDQDKEEYLNCKDNAISSLGKIIKQYADDSMDDLLVYWIEHMPIKLDLEECKVMNQLLAELLVSKPDVLLGDDLHRLPAVMEILGEQLHELYMTKDTITAFGHLLKDMQAIPMIKEAFEAITNDLCKKRIAKAIKAAQKDTPF